MTKFFTSSRGEGGFQTYQYFILLFFTLSVKGGRGKVNDTNFTLSAVFFWTSSLRELFRCILNTLNWLESVLSKSFVVFRWQIYLCYKYIHGSAVLICTIFWICQGFHSIQDYDPEKPFQMPTSTNMMLLNC